MNFILWATWALGLATMVTGVALISASRPPSHAHWGMCIFAVGFVVSVTSTCLLIVSPMR